MARIRVPEGALSLVALVFAALLAGNSVVAIKCYQCMITPPGQHSNQTTRLCVNFDYSEQYIVECKYSTMCMKQAFEYELRNGQKILSVQRDCAAQRFNAQVYNYSDGNWYEKVEVHESYEEGCKEQDDKGARLLAPTYCFCRKPLCNSAKTTAEHGYHTDAMAVIFMFNAVKYVRSMR